MPKNDFFVYIYYVKKIFFKFYFFVFKFLRKIFASLAETDFCEICATPCEFEKPVCADCERKFLAVKDLDEERCSVCGRFLISEEKMCMECREGRILKSTDGVFPLFDYLLWYKKLLFRWKINGERRYSEYFAGLIYERVSQIEKKYGKVVLVPVPPRKGKIFEKGWDQIQDLCFFLEVKFGCSVMGFFERVSFVQQKKLDRKERLETINNSYVLKKKIKSFPQNVCIIDDVLTTGSTIESCAFLLKSSGVSKVFAISLFIVS